ncbi:MAG: hypothetical protein KDA41_07335 [Planctomycetales bacterium]|nr:hypothetical protein [Planctomycetales bacterium]
MNRLLPRLAQTATMAACLFALPLAGTAWGQPAAVNTSSIRTTYGQPLPTRNAQPQLHAASQSRTFFAFHQGRLASRPGMFRGRANTVQFTQLQPEQQADNVGVLPSPHDPAGPEEVAGAPATQQDGLDPVIVEGMAMPPGGYIEGDGSCESCDDGLYCAECGPKSGYAAHWFEDWNWVCLCLPLPPGDNLSVNFGAHGFKGPLNSSFDSSFGFQAGVNLGAALPGNCWGLGWQVGVQTIGSNFEGLNSNVNPALPGDDRNQTFFTAGMFRRVDCGLQGGIAYDHLQDDWHYNYSLSQLRGEFSWVHDGWYEFGFFFNASLGSDTSLYNRQQTRSAHATDLYALFYRHHFDDCGANWGRIYLGLTGDVHSVDNTVSATNNALFGTDMHVGLSDCWALETGFTYSIPGGSNNAAVLTESWNVGFNLIWYPHGQTGGTDRGYYRPLFNVADNGTFLVDFNN